MAKKYNEYVFFYAENFEHVLGKLRKKDKVLHKRVKNKVEKIIDNPSAGKPLRNVLRNHWCAHVGHFVVIYEICQNEIRFLDIDHHDKIYKKFK